ncbi:hypothetical protein F2Q69_00043158 [Brassica cretica]|uniref:Uncharacterized protein n=1 Tax=Brassica cretica TaxID=69181 RepID=A0A8S9NMH8_BRACR|nr:hypothetical protein F2Q69_00043158 [Brassica cretica]
MDKLSVLKRPNEAEAKKKVAEAKKKEAELKKKQEAELKKQKQVGSKYKKVTPPRDGVTRCKVQPDVEDSSLADITDEVVAEQNEFAPESDVENFEVAELKKQKQAGSKYKNVTPPRDGVTRCKVQPDVEDSSLADITDEVVAEQNEFAPESDVENSEVVRSAIIKDYREKNVRLTPKGLSMTAVSSSLVFPNIGHNRTTCMKKNVTPSSAIYDPLTHVDTTILEKLMQHIKAIPPKPPAAPGVSIIQNS